MNQPAVPPGRDPLNHARALQAMGQHDQAIAIYREVLTATPDSLVAWNNLAVAFKAKGALEDAALAYGRAAKLNPNAAEIPYNLGNLYETMGRPAQAVAAYRRAVRLRPNYAKAHWNLALQLLVEGKFAEGFQEYEWRWQNPEFPTAPRAFAEPAWDGSPGTGTILIHAEQGIGDAIQFTRYARLVAALGWRVVMEVHAPLVSLLERVEGVSEIVALGATPPRFGVQLPMLSLPRALKTTLESIPSPDAYLSARPDLVARFRARIGGDGTRIGVVWAGAVGHGNDRNRSIALSTFARLFEADARFFSLQKEKREGDEALMGGIVDLGPELIDFEHTAAAIAALDLVISVDTSVAHLAGALGAPCWVMLPFVPDWRWLMERTDSPWYPSLRLFRQRAAGDWAEVIARVAAAIPSPDWRRPRS